VRFRLKVAVGVAVMGAAAVGTAAVAHDRNNRLEAFLHGYEEVPAVSTNALGSFKANISRDASQIDWTLTYGGTFNGTITQAHVHMAQRSVNGGIVVWFCQTGQANAPAGTQVCPQPAAGEKATLTGTWRSTEVTGGAAAQGLAAGEMAELIRALRGGVAYANVHSSTQGGGEIRGQVSDDRGHDH
jgi:CHRD domain